MIKKLDHMGIVVKNLEESALLYKNLLGISPWKNGVVEDTPNGVRILILPVADTFIELLQPTKPGNRYARFLAEKGGGLFHICCFVDDFEKRVSEAKKNGIPVEEEMGFLFPEHPFKLAWLPPSSPQGIWIELVDMADVPPEALGSNFS